MLRIELPPRSKKLSYIPTSCSPRSRDQMSAKIFSDKLRGGVMLPVSSGGASPGAGSARLSSFPFDVIGRRSRKTNDEGTIYSGRTSLMYWRSSLREG